jgi:hypothetical protein
MKAAGSYMKRQYISNSLHGITPQKTAFLSMCVVPKTITHMQESYANSKANK